MISEAVALVKQFHKGAEQPIGDSPTLLKPYQVDRRVRWIIDELKELEEAKTIEEQADAVTDCLYYLLGCYVEMGVDADHLFNIVHDANMRKLNSVRTDVDGRVLKPEDWKHPDEEIRQAITENEIKRAD